MERHLAEAIGEVERHAAERGWDQPPRLYALVQTADLVRQEPALAERLGLPAEPGPGRLTPVEQDPLPAEAPLDDVLARVMWPPEVHGCALVVERLMLPPLAEAELPTEGDVRDWVARRPDREEVRLVVGVTRDGSRESAVRLRSHDSTTEVVRGPELVPSLADALAATLAP